MPLACSQLGLPLALYTMSHYVALFISFLLKMARMQPDPASGLVVGGTGTESITKSTSDSDDVSTGPCSDDSDFGHMAVVGCSGLTPECARRADGGHP